MASGVSNDDIKVPKDSMESASIDAAAALTGKMETPENSNVPALQMDNINLVENKENTPTVQKAAADSSTVEKKYFFEDEVFRFDKRGRVKFGLVIETPDTASGDEDDSTSVGKGAVRVAWYPEGWEVLENEKELGLADRTLMPGDVVRRVQAGKSPQRGYCREISMYADVHVLGTRYVIKNVLSDRLRALSKWQVDSAVCLDSWVGGIKDFEERAVLRTMYGCRFEVSSNEYYIFGDFHNTSGSYTYNPQMFYPGNIVMGRIPSTDILKLLTPTTPLRTKQGKFLCERYVIESVYTKAVWVNWQCKALSDETCCGTNDLQQPCTYVTGENLKRLLPLNLFESCMLQINDRSYLKFTKSDSLIPQILWRKEQSEKFKGELPEGSSYLAAPAKNRYDLKFKKKLLGIHDGEKKSTKKSQALKAEKPSNLCNGKEKSPLSPQSGEMVKPEKISKDEEVITVEGNSPDTGWETDDGENGENDENSETFSLSNHSSDTSSTCSVQSLQRKNTIKKSINMKLYKSWAQCKHRFDRPNCRKTSTPDLFQPKEGDELMTETLLVYSHSTVVWQDGTIETNIPSTELLPVHHLDNHEYFPGDFVISGKEESNIAFRDYGVIQMVDHLDRTARVKWFTTYTTKDEPKPTYNGETEVSVYDLRDHPDFQYRPGTMVIRVANFVGDDISCNAGQIVDNYTDGQIKVWWVDGVISLCWPQDLFEVGQYDQPDWEHSSEDSWETESENSELGGDSKLNLEESHVISNIEHARAAIARLEEIFKKDPSLQNAEVMKRLMIVYKGCRGLDRLLDTTFFQEENFQGLIERVRRGGAQSISERAQDRKNRLFSSTTPPTTPTTPNDGKQPMVQPQQCEHCHFYHTSYVSLQLPASQTHHNHHHHHLHHQHHHHHHHNNTTTTTTTSTTTTTASSTTFTTINNSSRDYAPKVLFNISSTPFKCKTPTANGGSGGVGGGGGGLGHGHRSHNQSDSPPKIQKDTKEILPKVEMPLCERHALKKKHDPNSNSKSNSTEQNQLLPASLANGGSVIVSGGVSGVGYRNHHGESTPKHSKDSMLCERHALKKKCDANSNTDDSLCDLCVISNKCNKSYSAEQNRLLNTAMVNIERAYEKTGQLKSTTPGVTLSQDDSGNYSRTDNCDGSSTSYASSASDLTNTGDPANSSLTKVNSEMSTQSTTSIQLSDNLPPDIVCTRLCILLKEQLMKCITDIRATYYKTKVSNGSDAATNDDANSEATAKEDDNMETEEEEKIETEDGEKKEKKDKFIKVNVLDIDDEYIVVDSLEELTPPPRPPRPHRPSMIITDDDDVNESFDEILAIKELAMPKSPDGGLLSELFNDLDVIESETSQVTDDNTPQPPPPPSALAVSPECFQLLPTAPTTHKHHLSIFQPTDTQHYYRAVYREHRMLKSSLPPGVMVRAFEDRMDLLCIMMEGPKNTPYEDGLYFFDIQLGREFPRGPPLCHYLSFCSDRLNPNLYEDGKVCVSLLGTWSGRDTEVWGPSSTLLQVLVSIQGLILVAEPYFNEAGYEKQKGTQEGMENSRMYNEMAIIKMVQATTKLLENPPPIFRKEIIEYYKRCGESMVKRIDGYMKLTANMPNTKEATEEEVVEQSQKSEEELKAASKNGDNDGATCLIKPDFPLVPASRGFSLTLKGLLHNLKTKFDLLSMQDEQL